MEAMKAAAKAKAMDMGKKAMMNPEVQKKAKEIAIEQIKKDPKMAMDIGKQMVKEAMKKK